MLTRVDRSMRLRAGLLLAVIYQICVLVPGLSFAFSEARNARCLTDENRAAGIAHVHGQDARIVQHADVDFEADKHSGPVSKQARGEGGPSVSTETPSTGSDQHKSADSQCCGLTCVMALPATVTEFVQPLVPPSLCMAPLNRNVADNAPVRLYRPPIT